MSLIKECRWLIVLIITLSNVASAAGLATAPVTQSNNELLYTAEGVVEATKSSLIAPQVTGSITALFVKVGDHVKAGQLLARIDTRLAKQQAMTNQAQETASEAQLYSARKEYERKQRLYEKEYISHAALERAESDYKTAEAQSKAQLAQTGMSNVQTGLHAISAPYSGVVSEVMTELGGMATPGQPLLSLYDPTGFRITVNVPQSQLANLKINEPIKVQIPAANEIERSLNSSHLMVLPTTDPVSNMAMIRLTLPPSLKSISPGMFARAILPMNGSSDHIQIYVPAKAVIKRSELMAVYVVDKQGYPHLRQVRLGRKLGENIEVFAGLQVGEMVAIEPIAAANLK